MVCCSRHRRGRRLAQTNETRSYLLPAALIGTVSGRASISTPMLSCPKPLWQKVGPSYMAMVCDGGPPKLDLLTIKCRFGSTMSESSASDEDLRLFRHREHHLFPLQEHLIFD